MPTISTRPLDSQEQAGIAQATAWVNDVLERGFRSDIRLRGRREDIPTLHSLLGKGPFGADAASELTVFGTVFGEILATEIPMRWVVYQDEHGADFALQYQDLDLFVFPRDMILKRVERGENVESINLEVMLEEIRKSVHDDAQNVSKRVTS
jgi:hypothetical protein